MEELNEHFIEVGRLAALRAFYVPTKPGSSSMAAFSGQRPPKKNRGPGGKWETEEKKQRRKSGDAELHATETRPPGFSRPPIPEWTEIAGRVRQAIAELRDLERYWVNFAYRPPGNTRLEYGARFQRRFFAEYQARSLGSAKARTREVVKNLLAVAMANEAEPGTRVYPDVDPEDRRSWNRTLRPHFFQLRVDLADLDRRACHAIGEKLTEK